MSQFPVIHGQLLNCGTYDQQRHICVVGFRTVRRLEIDFKFLFLFKFLFRM